MNYQTNRSLSEFSTFGIGGPIRYFASVSTIQDLKEIFSDALEKQLPLLLLGKGSNCLFPDRGFAGIAILMKIDHCEWEEERVRVGAGFPFSLLGVQTARKGFSGLEFASGIPASVGGAVFMNAGANGKETAEALVSVLFLHRDGREQLFVRQELDFHYRSSPFQTMEGAIIEATFLLTKQENARQKQLVILEGRMKSQPLKDKSAGCTFRNPGSGVSAGALIDQCGLKGVSVGGAKVSEIHANFIVNKGQATSQDVKELIHLIQSKVLAETQIHLEPEIRIFD